MFSMNGLKTVVWRILTGGSPRVTLLILIILCCMGVTCYSHFILHSGIVFSHFFYIPIVLSAFWWGRRAIWVALFLGAWLVTSHTLAGLGTPVPDLSRAGMFIAVSLVVGMLREQILNTELRLRETRDYLENLLNHANAPIIVWDPSFRITRFNHAFERLTGYAVHEVVGRKLHMLFPEASRDESLKKIACTLNGEFGESVEIPILCKDGGSRIVVWNWANIHAEDRNTVLATIAQGQDITERKEM